MCCELLLCDEMTIIEFIQIPFLQKSVLNYLKYKLDNINKFNMEKKVTSALQARMCASAGPLFMQ